VQVGVLLTDDCDVLRRCGRVQVRHMRLLGKLLDAGVPISAAQTKRELQDASYLCMRSDRPN
jgi:hypothetical protein